MDPGAEGNLTASSSTPSLVCPGDVHICDLDLLRLVVHALQTYCCGGALVYVICFRQRKKNGYNPDVRWFGEKARVVASMLLGATTACSIAAAALRPDARLPLLAAGASFPAWLVSDALHLLLERRGAGSGLLAFSAYWWLVSVLETSRLGLLLSAGADRQHVQIHLHIAVAVLAAVLAIVDSVGFYLHITKSQSNLTQRSGEESSEPRPAYEHHSANLYSRWSFFWMRNLLYAGCSRPLELADLSELPAREKAELQCGTFKNIYTNLRSDSIHSKSVSLWPCYLLTIWPNFYIGGVLKLLGDMVALVPAMGISVVVQYAAATDASSVRGAVTVSEFVNNGYVMALLILMASVAQGVLSQNSTHLVYVEGIRLKAALQGLIFDKCLNLAAWITSPPDNEDDALLMEQRDTEKELGTNLTPAGLVTNLLAQDTYNVMSFVWIGHYFWAIPVKLTAILYLLYTKLGVSAIIGSLTAICLVTPLQFYVGMKMSDNSKETSKISDQRVSKMLEILQGMKTIKMQVWEDLFKEKILNVREVELKLLNKESAYWGTLTFLTQAATLLICAVTLSVHVLLEGGADGADAASVFAGLTLASQLTVPLLVLPAAVYMLAQAAVSTKRIQHLLKLPESANGDGTWTKHCTQHSADVFSTSNVRNVSNKTDVPTGSNGIPCIQPSVLHQTKLERRNGAERHNSIRRARKRILREKLNSGFLNELPADAGVESAVHMESARRRPQEHLLRMRNAVFSWHDKDDTNFSIEIDKLDIEPGKLIMVVGPTGSGKSSLLSAILGEMHLMRGDVKKSEWCSTSYAGQLPWMVNAHVRENVVMCGSGEWSPRRYSGVLRAVGLLPDVKLLPEGDLTRLGELGVSMSGGQRARVCVARALYSPARLVVLDDPLGALDAQLASHLLVRALVPAARKGRTVVLATNRLDMCNYADVVVVMEEGRIRCAGVPRDVCAADAFVSAELAASRLARGASDVSAVGERERLRCALHRASLRAPADDEPSRPVRGGYGVLGSAYVAELPSGACGGTGTWACRTQPRRVRPLLRQLSSPAAPAALKPYAVSRPWTPRQLRRLFSNESTASADLTDNELDRVEDCETAANLAVDPPGSGGQEGPLETTSAAKLAISGVPGCVYVQYVRACGWWAPAYCVAALASQLLNVAADCWLAASTRGSLEHHHQTRSWVWRYAGVCLCGLAAAAVAQACAACGGAAARRRLHARLLHVVLHLPLRHFDTAPLGRSLNRFAADMMVVDKKVCGALQRWSQFVLMCASAVVVNVAVTPWCLLAAVPLAAVYCALQEIYARNARSLQRLDALTTSPAVSLVAEARAGAAVVRAGRLQPRMRAQMWRRLDDNTNVFLLLNAANRWLGLALDLLGACVVYLSLMTAVAISRAAPASVPPSVVGLVASYTLLLPAYLAWVGKFRSELDLHMGATERILHYTDLPMEDYREEAEATLPTQWGAAQDAGSLVMEDASVRHASGLPDVLKRVNLVVRPGDKVAVCGRSGGGKSTLLLALCGAGELSAGVARVDGVDLRTLPLRLLRRRLVLLPQDAAVFSGTLRENLDPLGMHTDAELWHCLRLVRLQEFVAAHPAGLECSVRGDGSAGWSAGQRARVCCARAVLSAACAPVLLLDEPAAALDARSHHDLLANIAADNPHRTLIIVTHRRPRADQFTRVVSIEGGTVLTRDITPTVV